MSALFGATAFPDPAYLAVNTFTSMPYSIFRSTNCTLGSYLTALEARRSMESTDTYYECQAPQREITLQSDATLLSNHEVVDLQDVAADLESIKTAGEIIINGCLDARQIPVYRVVEKMIEKLEADEVSLFSELPAQYASLRQEMQKYPCQMTPRFSSLLYKLNMLRSSALEAEKNREIEIIRQGPRESLSHLQSFADILDFQEFEHLYQNLLGEIQMTYRKLNTSAYKIVPDLLIESKALYDKRCEVEKIRAGWKEKLADLGSPSEG